MRRPRSLVIHPLIWVQHFIRSSHPVVGRSLGCRARILPVGKAVAHLVTPLPHGALLWALWSGLDGTPHHLRRHVLLRPRARGSRDPVPAKLEWELVLGPSSRPAVCGRVGISVLVVQLLLWGRLGGLLLAWLLSLCRRKLRLRLSLARAVRDAVHLPFVALGRGAVVAL